VKLHPAIHRVGCFVAILTLTILSCSGASGISRLFGTETPTPTNTYTPSPTFTPSPTATATETQTPLPTALPVGVKTEEQADGSTLLIDYDNQYQLTIPDGWAAIPLSAEDLADAINKLSEKNPAFKDLAETFKKLDPNIIRVIAVNTDTEYTADGFATNMTITAIQDKILSTMPLDFVTGALEEAMKQQGAIVLATENPAKTNANGVEVGTFDFEQTTPTAAGANVQVRSKVLVFQSKGKVIMVQLATPRRFGDQLVPALDGVYDSISLLDK